MILIVLIIRLIIILISNNENKKNISNSTMPLTINDSNDLSQDENLITIEETVNHNPENVTIEIDNDTVKSESLSIIITDNNVNPYGWGMDFKIQKKTNENWEDLNYISDDIVWIDIIYELNESNQWTQKLDIETYYGTLSNGIYRIVKPVIDYDGNYVNIYSNEFEIK